MDDLDPFLGRFEDRAALLYNLLLTEAYDEAAPEPKDWATDYNEALEDWAVLADDMDLAGWCQSTAGLWSALASSGAHINDATRLFVNQFAAVVSTVGPAALAESQPARELVRNRELQHKRGQARFRNKKRLLAYPGYAGTTPMEYRWTLVRRLLNDIAGGLALGDSVAHA